MNLGDKKNRNLTSTASALRETNYPHKRMPIQPVRRLQIPQPASSVQHPPLPNLPTPPEFAIHRKDS